MHANIIFLSIKSDNIICKQKAGSQTKSCAHPAHIGQVFLISMVSDRQSILVHCPLHDKVNNTNNGLA